MIPYDLAESEFQYAALSYCWGEPIFSEHLHVQEALPITRSLCSALRRIRHLIVSVYIWADGACINQSDLAERNLQVLLMGKIYRQASEVLIYLGEDEDHSDLVPLLLPAADHIFLLSTSKRTSLPSSGSYLNKHSEIRQRQRPSNQQMIAAWRAFLRRPWFMRLWVIQEAALATRAIALCGCWAVSFEYLVNLATGKTGRDFEESASMRLKTFNGSRQLMIMGRINELVRTGNRVDNLWLLSRTRRSLATNPADYLWGVLGLGNWGHGTAILPDYAQPLNETLKRFARFFVEDGLAMEMLYYAHVDSWRAELPSWVPGWAIHDNSEYSTFWDTSRLSYLGSTGLPEFSLSNDANVLSVKGRQIGTVDGLGESQRKLLDMINSSPRESFESPLRSWISTVDSMLTSSSQKDPQALAVIKWSTLVLGAPDYELFMSKTKSSSNVQRNSLLTKPISKSKALDHTYGPWYVGGYIREAIRTGQSLRLGRSSKAGICQVPYGSDVGDDLVLLRGSRVPFVLRRLPGRPFRECYRVVGPCFVHSFMGGAQVSMLDDPLVRIFGLV
jgi:hypothetical protein